MLRKFETVPKEKIVKFLVRERQHEESEGKSVSQLKAMRKMQTSKSTKGFISEIPSWHPRDSSVSQQISQIPNNLQARLRKKMNHT